MTERLKLVEFRSCLDDLRDFPIAARRQAGYQIDRLQRGLDPDDWRPMTSVGQTSGRFASAKRAGHFESSTW